jgi:hypothetical protein
MIMIEKIKMIEMIEKIKMIKKILKKNIIYLYYNF